MSNFNILDKIDSKLDELDVLINELTIPNKKEYCQQIYNLFASLERAVEENF